MRIGYIGVATKRKRKGEKVYLRGCSRRSTVGN